MAKKIDPKAILLDINAGFTESALMAKHDLTPQQLRITLKKLREPEPSPKRSQGKETIHREPGPAPGGECPACGLELPLDAVDCPMCGIVPSELDQAPGKEPSLKKAGAVSGSFVLVSSKSFYYSNILSALVLIAVIVGGFVLYGSFQRFVEYNSALVEIRPTILYLSQAKRADWGLAEERLDSNLRKRKDLLSRYPDLYSNLTKIVSILSDLKQAEQKRTAPPEADDGDIAATSPQAPSGEAGEATGERDAESGETQASEAASEDPEKLIRRLRLSLARSCSIALKEM